MSEEKVIKKYKADVHIQTVASKHIGTVEFDTIEEFYDKADKLWESRGWDSPSLNCHNDFDLGGDWELNNITESDLKYFEK